MKRSTKYVVSDVHQTTTVAYCRSRALVSAYERQMTQDCCPPKQVRGHARSLVVS